VFLGDGMGYIAYTRPPPPTTIYPSHIHSTTHPLLSLTLSASLHSPSLLTTTAHPNAFPIPKPMQSSTHIGPTSHQPSVLHSQFAIRNSQFSILNSQFSIPNSQFSILNSQFSILNSQFSILNSQFSILNSQFLPGAI